MRTGTQARTGARSRRHRRDEAGYVAVVTALLASTIFLGMAAMGVDTARWYMELEKVQKAADSAALAGVTYLPNDLANARVAALAAAQKNGYDDASPEVVVTTAIGSKPSELKVTIRSRVANTFGASFGQDRSWMTRSATADFTAPAPMGSPCNTFGNEPPPGKAGPLPLTTALPPTATRFPNCPADATGGINPGFSNPKLWAAVEGPETDKLQGDRYQALKCNESSGVNRTDPGPYACASSKNSEYKQQGYYLVVNVEQAAVNQQIDIQVYDPAFVPAGLACEANATSGITDTMNDYVSDGTNRYGRYKSGISSTTVINAAAQKFCTGDAFVGGSVTSRAATTTYAMKNQSDANNPDRSTYMSACPAKQFRGFTTAPTAAALTKSSSTYNDQLAQVYHQWVSVCKFTPTVKGNYFLQVRTNVSLGGTSVANTKSNQPVVYTNNSAAYAVDGNTTQGAGANAFSVRAVPQPVTSTSTRDDVSVSAWERLPLLQIAASPATFNLVRALPNAKGQYLTFDFFDAADGSDGSVTVLPPPDATGDVKLASGIPGCKAGKNSAVPTAYTALTGCKVTVQGSNTDGQLMHMVIPIPQNYNCNNATLGGCWFQVKLDYGSTVTDFTTWSANIGGDPVRLIE